MAARSFISYRSSDGKDQATALARDLGAAFGDAQVFFDKDDLRATLAAHGASMSATLWRNSAQADRPVTRRRVRR